MKMEMQLNRIIVLFFFYTSVLMSQIVSEKEENLKFSQIDFFDKKYEKAIYSLIIDESNISDDWIFFLSFGFFWAFNYISDIFLSLGPSPRPSSE